MKCAKCICVYIWRWVAWFCHKFHGNNRDKERYLRGIKGDVAKKIKVAKP